jgi:hypothetical protein
LRCGQRVLIRLQNSTKNTQDIVTLCTVTLCIVQDMKKIEPQQLSAMAMKPRILVSDELRERLNLEADDSQLAIINKMASVNIVLTSEGMNAIPLVGNLRGIESHRREHVIIEMKTMTSEAEMVFALYLQRPLFTSEFEVQFCDKQIKSPPELSYRVVDMTVSDFDLNTEMCIVTLGLVKQ